MRRVAVAIAASLLLVLAGCSGGGAPRTGTGTDAQPTTEAPISNGTPIQTPTASRAEADYDRIPSRRALERVTMGLASTKAGLVIPYISTYTHANATSGANTTRVVRMANGDRTAYTADLPANWSTRLVRNLDDRQRSEPGTVLEAADTSRSFTFRLQFETTTVRIRSLGAAGADTVEVAVGDNRTYYSDDPELLATVGQLRRCLSEPAPPVDVESWTVLTDSPGATAHRRNS